uniref:Fucolectin-related molecule n=1 Tax=Littorina littorea TaxID=31216 RepID=A0A0A7RRH9_LITLI|nr:fucolectin-related molecule [Littorina littorea]
MARGVEASCRCYLFLSLMLWHGCIFRQFVEGSFGTPLEDITVTASTNKNELSLTKHAEVNGQIVALWTGGPFTTTWIRIESTNSFSLCLIKVYDVTLREYCECDDACHRNADVICHDPHQSPELQTCSDPQNCRQVNVALNKTAKMSSSYRKSEASYAVNGITGTTFSAPDYTNDSTQWNCIHTGDTDWSPYWQVDLGKEYTVDSVIIYRRGGGPGKARMVGVTVTVDDNLCKTISYADATDEKMSVICSNPTPRGRFLNITRRGNLYDPYINLCEVQVWVCKPGYYGFGCTSKCSEGCSGEMTDCDIDNGFCTNGCDDGWYTATCSQECGGGCTGGRCNQTDGQCSPCLPNWTGDKCDQCDAQHYGDDCSKACGHCRDQNRCDRRDGSCPNDNPRCQPGYTGLHCNESCSPGRYGPDCRQSCSEGCRSAACDGTTGHCKCRHGWQESDPFCTKKCDSETYGTNCSRECGVGCQNINSCDRTTGHCSCRIGYQPPLCDKAVDLTSAATVPATSTTQAAIRHEVVCGSTSMSFSIPMPTDFKTATLSDPRCQARTSSNNSLYGSTNLNDCGTTLQVTNDSIVFSNNIILPIDDSSNSSVIRVIPIMCRYDRMTDLTVSAYMPVVRQVLFTETGVGQLSFRIRQYRDSSFTGYVSDSAYPLRLMPSEEVFVQLDLGGQQQPQGFGMDVVRCVASPSPSYMGVLGGMSRENLIDNNCPASTDVHLRNKTISATSNHSLFRFSFKAVTFPDPNDPQRSRTGLVYIHCRVRLCASSECGSGGQCPSPSALSRNKREAEGLVGEAGHQLSTGPLLVEGHSGESNAFSPLVVVMGAIAACATLVAMVAVVAWRRSRHRGHHQRLQEVTAGQQ